MVGKFIDNRERIRSLLSMVSTKCVRSCTSGEQMVFMKLKIVLCQHAILE